MAYVSPSNRTTGDLITAADWNQDVVDNMKANPAELSKAGNGGKVVALNAGETALEYADVSSPIIAEPFQWQSKIATRYVAHFRGTAILSNADYGDLPDVGWKIDGTPTAPGILSGVRTGLLDDRTNVGSATGDWLTFTADERMASPAVIGGYTMLEALEQITGERKTTIKVWVVTRLASALDASNGSGVGITTTSGNANNGYFLMAGDTNFEIFAQGVAIDTGVPIDTDAHSVEFNIDIAGVTYSVDLDGAEVVSSRALVTDKWPMMLSVQRDGTASRDIQLSEWGVNFD